MFRCRKGSNYLWLPLSIDGAIALGELMRHGKSNEGYCIYLNHASRRPAKIMLAKMQRLQRLSTDIVDNLQFAKLTDKILSEKEYDRYGQELSEVVH